MSRVFALCSLLILLAGCGQKGDLYRPQDSAIEPTATQQPVPVREEEEDNEITPPSATVRASQPARV
jgi:predicted small lipoprotein YifL